MARLPWPDYFMHIVDLVRERSTCLRRHVGALAVRDNRILATGYNGVPQGLTHCLDIGCLRQKLAIPSGQRHEICRGLHAEQNVIIQAASYGINIQGADIYTTTYPCVLCCKMLINCRVRHIYYAECYPDELSQSMLQEAGIPVTQIAIPNADPSPSAACDHVGQS